MIAQGEAETDAVEREIGQQFLSNDLIIFMSFLL